MSILWTYGAGIVTILLAFLSLVEDFYIKKNPSRRIGMSIGLIVATLVTMVSIRAADKQHTEDEGRITALQRQIETLGKIVRDANQAEKDNTVSLSTARAADTKQFLTEFDKLSARVASLQTQVATTDLKSEAEKLQGELESTRKAMVPPKATLTFSLKSDSDNLVHALSVEQVNKVVHLNLTIENATDVDALDGDTIVTLCDKCKFKSEPAMSQRPNGAPENQRNISFQRILAHTKVTTDLDIEAPAFPFQISVISICHTCTVIDPKARFFPDSRAVINAINPPEPERTFPLPASPPFFNKL